MFLASAATALACGGPGPRALPPRAPSTAGGVPSAATAPPSRAEADPKQAAQSADDGFAALGLTGIANDGRGRGEGICLCGDDTIDDMARLRRRPRVRLGAMQVSGPLPPEVIQRLIRQRFENFDVCYQRGRRANPSLAGVIETTFVIDSSGKMVNVNESAATNLPDRDVVTCVMGELRTISFPAPEGTSVKVSCPLIFVAPVE